MLQGYVKATDSCSGERQDVFFGRFGGATFLALEAPKDRV